MANRKPCYFLAPTWDFPPPPSGPIKLGSVITALEAPERSLSTASLPTGDDPGQAFSTQQRQVTYTSDRLRQGQFGIFTQFLGLVIGLDVEATVDWGKGDTSLFTFDTLETIQFIPSPEFTRICITNPAVKRFLEKSRYRKPVYIITGIKTARGAKAKTTSTRSGSIGLKVGTDGSLSGTPISLGPSVNEQKASKQSAGWESGSDFVFAFRVRKVLVKKKAGTVKLEEDYAKGAMFEKEVSIGIKEPELEIVFDGEVNVEGEGLDYKELFDEDEMVCCVKPA